VVCRLYDAAPGARALLCVGGVGGGFDSPAADLYPRLCEELAAEGARALRVRFRNPVDLSASVADVLAGVDLLARLGVERVALLGHSFGGAVVIAAAARTSLAGTVIALATQSYGAAAAAELGPRCSILLLHGTGDRVLPDVCSRHVYSIAREPKELRLLPGVGHTMVEAADDVHDIVTGWLRAKL
jgi:dienelactone hydrolase